jgi:chromosomal replication initiator protein
VEVEEVDDEVVHLTVATRFLRNWLRSHYYDFVLRLSRAEWPTVERVEFKVRQPHFGNDVPKEPRHQRLPLAPVVAEAPPLPLPLRTGYGGFEGSPLDPRLSFTSFVVGASNRLAYAAAQEVASAFSTPQPLFNPLFVHGNVGLRQNPPPARYLVGRKTAKARSPGALPDRRALYVRLRASLARPRCARLQGESFARSTFS